MNKHSDFKTQKKGFNKLETKIETHGVKGRTNYKAATNPYDFQHETPTSKNAGGSSSAKIQSPQTVGDAFARPNQIGETKQFSKTQSPRAQLEHEISARPEKQVSSSIKKQAPTN